MWVLGTQLGCLARSTNALNPRVISAAPKKPLATYIDGMFNFVFVWCTPKI